MKGKYMSQISTEVSNTTNNFLILFKWDYLSIYLGLGLRHIDMAFLITCSSYLHSKRERERESNRDRQTALINRLRRNIDRWKGKGRNSNLRDKSRGQRERMTKELA